MIPHQHTVLRIVAIIIRLSIAPFTGTLLVLLPWQRPPPRVDAFCVDAVQPNPGSILILCRAMESLRVCHVRHRGQVSVVLSAIRLSFTPGLTLINEVVLIELTHKEGTLA